MLGAITGDICGSRYEFNNEKDYDRIELYRHGSFPTDDSILTIAVARALMLSKGKSDDETRAALVNELHSFGRMYPNAGYGQTFYNWLRINDKKPYNSYGNGSAMRVSSAGWLYDTLEETLKYARISAEVTHNHPEGIKGAQATALVIFLARNGYSKEEIRKELNARFPYGLGFTIAEKRETYIYDITCQGTMPVALEAFFEARDFMDAIKLAISVGGDSDTIGAITGSMAEAYFGIPEFFIENTIRILQDNESKANPVLTSVISSFYQKYA